ncbi:hypothetical protein BDW75DRAFT_213390 [Aspergillus navahoensis]
MKDPNQMGAFPQIHLVHWKRPVPVGKPYFSHAHVGWFRMVVGVENIDVARAELEEAGYKPFAPTTDTKATFHTDIPEIEYRIFSVHDPDGITLEYYHSRPVTTSMIAQNTANISKNNPFMTEILGMDFLQGSQSKMNVSNVYSPGGDFTKMTGGVFSSAAIHPYSLTGFGGLRHPSIQHLTKSPLILRSCESF